MGTIGPTPPAEAELSASAPAFRVFDVTLDEGMAPAALLLALLGAAGLDATTAEAEGVGRALAAAAPSGAAEADLGAIVAGRHTTLWLQARTDPVAGAAAFRWRGLLRDVTDRRTTERHEHLVRREMAHRVKNLFAVVSALLSISARDVPEVQAYAQDMRRRIAALSVAYRYLEGEPGPEEGGTPPMLALGSLLREVLAPYGEAMLIGLRPVVEGLAIGPRAATGVALTLHELATNASKHGALARPGGHVRLRAWRTDGWLRLSWRETGGPALAGPPEVEGFGTRLLDRIAGQLLGATMERRWLPHGLHVVLAMPVARLEA